MVDEMTISGEAGGEPEKFHHPELSLIYTSATTPTDPHLRLLSPHATT